MVNFRQHDERHISAEVKLLKWNPKMDLVAVALKNGDLSVHRLMGWQRVCMLPSPGPHPRPEGKSAPSGTEITCIEWRPDGKILAVGYSRNIKCLDEERNSCVILLDIENGDILNVIEIDDNKVLSLCWESQHADDVQQPNYESCSYNDYLHKLKPLAKAYSNPSCAKLTEDTMDDVMKVSSQTSLNLLAIGAEKGCIWLYCFGLFRCGQVMVPQQSSISYLSISKDLRLINALCSSQPSDDGANQSYKLVSYIIDPFLENSKQYLFLTRIYCKMISLLLYLNETIQAVQETWEDILLEIDAKLCNYTESAGHETSSKSMPLLSDEFLELLVFGTASDTLEKFMHDLTDKGLKKLGHSIELTYSNLQKLVVINIQRVSLHIYCHLNTLKSLSLWTSEFGALGLSTSTIDQALKAVGSFHLKSLELQQVIDISMRNVKCFFRWLYVTMLRLCNDALPISQTELTKMSQQDVQYIAEFIQENFEVCCKQENRPTASNFTLERVGQYLKAENLNCQFSATYNLCSNPWIQYLNEHPELEKLGKDILRPHNLDRSLVQEHESLNHYVNLAFDGPFYLFNQTIAPAFSEIRNIVRGSSLDEWKISHVTNSVLNCHLVTFLLSTDTQTVLYALKYDLKHSNIEYLDICSTLFLESDLNKPLVALDFQFYNEEILSLLLNEQESNTAYLVQLPIRTLCRLMSRCPTSFDISNHLETQVPSVVKISEHSAEVKCRKLENLRALRLAVSGSRKVASVLSQSRRRVRIFEMDVSEEDEVEDELDVQEQDKTS